jgi:hypothetical protein
MSIPDRIQESFLWKTGEIFTTSDIARSIGVTLGAAKGGINDMKSRGEIILVRKNMKGACYRRNMPNKVIRNAWRTLTDEQLGI